MDVLEAVSLGLIAFGLAMFLLLALDLVWEWASTRRDAARRRARIRADARRAKRQLADQAFRVQRDMVRHATETMRRNRR